MAQKQLKLVEVIVSHDEVRVEKENEANCDWQR